MQINIGDLVTALSFVGGILVWIIYSIIAPLKVLLTQTIKTMNELKETIKEEREKRVEIALRLESVEARSKSNTKRLDALESWKNNV